MKNRYEKALQIRFIRQIRVLFKPFFELSKAKPCRQDAGAPELPLHTPKSFIQPAIDRVRKKLDRRNVSAVVENDLFRFAQ
jgi:hypothetical protein